MNEKGNTIFWAVIACLLWSTAYAGIKLGLQYDKPFHFAGVRYIISIPVVGTILSWLMVPDEKPEWITISGIVIITGSLIMFFRSTKESHSK